MARKLKKLLIDRVDLVPDGANPDAHILLFKQDGESEPPLTTGEIVAQQEAMEQLCRLRSALWDSVYSIFEHAPLADQPDLLLQSVQEFAAFARQAIEQMGAMEKGAPLLTELDGIAKAGRKISAARLKRLKAIMAELEAIMTEGDSMADTAKRVEELEAQHATVLKRAEVAEAKILALESDLAKAQELANAADPEARRQAIVKSLTPEQRELYEMERADRLKETEIAKANRDALEKQECITKAHGFKALVIKADDDWELFKALKTLEKKHQDRLEVILKAADEAVRQSKLFKEIGRNGEREAEGDSAEAQAMVLAKVEQEKDSTLSFPEALNKVWKANESLYEQYRVEKRAQARMA